MTDKSGSGVASEPTLLPCHEQINGKAVAVHAMRRHSSTHSSPVITIRRN
jgi:hypothetical protein